MTLPALIMPVTCLVVPAMAMALLFLHIQKNKIS